MKKTIQTLIAFGLFATLSFAQAEVGGTITRSLPNNDADQKVCTMQYEPVCGVDGVTYGNACMANDVEIAYEGMCFADELSDNDKNYYETLQTRVSADFQSEVKSVIKNYSQRMEDENWSDAKKERVYEIYNDTVEKKIFSIAMNNPQDVALPDAINKRYMKLNLLKFELMRLKK